MDEVFLKIRQIYYRKLNQSLKVPIYILGASIVIGITMDIFLPFINWFNYLRFIPAMGVGASLFFLVYMYDHINREKSRAVDPEVPVTLKEKYPPNFRKLVGITGLALVLVIFLGNGYSPAYTTISGILMASTLFLFSFILKTQVEIEREEMGIPDPRDVLLQKKIEEAKAKANGEEEIKEVTGEDKKRRGIFKR